MIQSSSKSHEKQTHSCCEHKDQICQQQINHLINVIKQRYISPYKIIYMINQQQADYFKLRNKGSGCCASSIITIPKDQMTKTQQFLSQVINQTFKANNLNKILEQLSDKYDNIVKSGQKQNLKVDDQVQKFLLQKTLSEGFNLHIYKQVMQKIKKQSQNISNSAMMWATPTTWYAKYPNTPLNFLSSKTLSDLNNQKKGFGCQIGFLKDYKYNLLKELKLLEQDGKFEQQIWTNQQSTIRNDTKVLMGLQRYSYDGTQASYQQGQITYQYLKKSLLTLRSIPFQLNAKLNAYCTISQNNQVSFFKDSIVYKLNQDSKQSRFLTYCQISQHKIKCFIKNKKTEQLVEQKFIESGDLMIVDNQINKIQLSGASKNIFLFKSWIGTLARKN